MDMFEKLDHEDKKRAAALKELTHYKLIAVELQELGYTITAHVNSGAKTAHLRDKNNKVIFGIDFVPQYSGQGFYSRHTGKMNVSVRATPQRAFRELKAGGYNYKGIAAALVFMWEQEAAVVQKRDVSKNNSQICAEIREELGFENSWGDINGFNVRATEYTDHPLRVSFKMAKTGNADDARAMFKLLKDAGFINND